MSGIGIGIFSILQIASEAMRVCTVSIIRYPEGNSDMNSPNTKLFELNLINNFDLRNYSVRVVL